MQVFRRPALLPAAIIMAAAVACSAAPGTPSTSKESTTAAPEIAANVGYSALLFNDDFDDVAGIDLSGTGVAGHRWYTDRPFGFGVLPPSDLAVRESVLEINQSTETFNYGIASVSSSTNAGSAYRYGYFEARMAFDPDSATESEGWPSFWLLARDRVTGLEEKRWAELDVFEAWHEPGNAYDNNFVGTVHDWVRTSGALEDRSSVGNHTHPLENVDFRDWHTYSVLWSPGHVTWYFDGQALLTQSYSELEPSPNPANRVAGTFSSLDAPRGMAVILGSGVGYKLRVDWVRVWR